MRINIHKVPQRAEASKYSKVSKNAQSAQLECEHLNTTIPQEDEQKSKLNFYQKSAIDRETPKQS